MTVIKNKPLKPLKVLMPEPEGFSDRLMSWAEANMWYLIAGVVGILVVAASVLGYQSHHRNKEARAQDAYVAVLSAWPQGDVAGEDEWEKFRLLSEDFIQQHGKAGVALHARLDLTRAHYAAGKYEEAYRWGQEVLRQVTDRHPVKSLADYQMALICRQLGKNEEALAHWRSLEKSGGPGLQREVHWQIARIYIDKNDYQEAVSYYERALTAPGGYPIDEMIHTELASARARQGD